MSNLSSMSAHPEDKTLGDRLRFTIDKQTAKDICAIRKAQNTIDRFELDDGFGFKPPDSPNIAYLKNGTMLPPFRCDIVSRWTALVDRQQGACPDTEIHFSYNDKGEITLQCGQSSVRLYAIDEGSEPPIHPLPITIEGDSIKLAMDAKELTDKAKLLTSNAARVKKESAERAKTKAEQAALAEYERCKAIMTPEAVKHCAKRVNRLRKLKSWLRTVDKVLDTVPALPQLIRNPIFNAFDPAYSKCYGDARLAYLETARKRDNFKPRSWRSKGLEKHNENVKLALSRVRDCALNALEHHIRASGFIAGGFTTWDHRRYNANDVRRCREYMRTHERKEQMSAS